METPKLTKPEFARKAVLRLRTKSEDGRQYLGIHTVYSKFNAAWKMYFPGSNPVEDVKQLIIDGHLAGNPTKGGYRIYLPEDKPKGVSPEAILSKILG